MKTLDSTESRRPLEETKASLLFMNRSSLLRKEPINLASYGRSIEILV